jgi:hypothetical protein
MTMTYKNELQGLRQAVDNQGESLTLHCLVKPGDALG